jgi:protein TonB
MLKSFLKSLLLHIALVVLLVFAYLSPTAIKKPNKKPVTISFAVPNPTKDETTIKKETNEKPMPKELPVKVKPTPAEKKPQDAKVKKIAPEKSTQVQAKPQAVPSEMIKQTTSIPSIPNTLPLYAQAPVKPSMPSSPMQKAVLPQPEMAPSHKEQSQVQMHAPVQAIASIAAVSAINNHPLHAVAPVQPSMASLPMQKPTQPKAEASPTAAASTMSEAIVAPNSPPQAIANSMTTPPAVPSTTAPAQSTPNAPSSHTNPTADETNSAKQAYLRSIAEQIKKYKTYPKEAKENNNIMGNVKVIFRINADGSIAKIAIVDSSGSEILDKAAVDLILSITKFQALPTILGKAYMDITLNIDYSLK